MLVLLPGAEEVAVTGAVGMRVGRYGRAARVAVAGWLTLGAVWQVGRPTVGVSLSGPAPRPGAVAAAMAGGFLLATVAVYWLLLRLGGERVLARLNPWSRAALLLVPVNAAIAAAVVTDSTALLAAELAYVGVSLLAAAVGGYGGCEVVALPLLWLRRRYTVYCALNALDALENTLTAGRGALHAAAGALTVAGGAYFLVIQNALGLAGVRPGFDRWLTVLFLPALLLAARRFPSRRTAALALAATMLTILTTGSVWLLYPALTALIMLAGAVLGVRQATHRADRDPEPVRRP